MAGRASASALRGRQRHGPWVVQAQAWLERRGREQAGSHGESPRRWLPPQGAPPPRPRADPGNARGFCARTAGARDNRRPHQPRYGQNDPVMALGRRNWTFAGSNAGGERAAAIYRLVETAKLHGFYSDAYLRHVLERIADFPVNHVTDLLPWNTTRLRSPTRSAHRRLISGGRSAGPTCSGMRTLCRPPAAVSAGADDRALGCADRPFDAGILGRRPRRGGRPGGGAVARDRARVSASPAHG